MKIWNRQKKRVTDDTEKKREENARKFEMKENYTENFQVSIFWKIVFQLSHLHKIYHLLVITVVVVVFVDGVQCSHHGNLISISATPSPLSTQNLILCWCVVVLNHCGYCMKSGFISSFLSVILRSDLIRLR